jgi:hypothetical protein
MVLSWLSETSSIWTHRPCSCPDRHRNPVRKSDPSIDTKEATCSDQSDLNRSGTVGQDVVQWLSEIQKRMIAAAMHLHSDRSRIPVSCDHVYCLSARGRGMSPTLMPHTRNWEQFCEKRQVCRVQGTDRAEVMSALHPSPSPLFSRKSKQLIISEW